MKHFLTNLINSFPLVDDFIVLFSKNFDKIIGRINAFAESHKSLYETETLNETNYEV